MSLITENPFTCNFDSGPVQSINPSAFSIKTLFKYNKDSSNGLELPGDVTEDTTNGSNARADFCSLLRAVLVGVFIVFLQRRRFVAQDS